MSEHEHIYSEGEALHCFQCGAHFEGPELNALLAEVAQLRSELAEARAALWKYGRHLNNDCLEAFGECACGWAQLLARLRAGAPTQEARSGSELLRSIHERLAGVPESEIEAALAEGETWTANTASTTTSTVRPAPSEEPRAQGGRRRPVAEQSTGEAD